VSACGIRRGGRPGRGASRRRAGGSVMRRPVSPAPSPGATLRTTEGRNAMAARACARIADRLRSGELTARDIPPRLPRHRGPASGGN
jgi:hypothetical protein